MLLLVKILLDQPGTATFCSKKGNFQRLISRQGKMTLTRDSHQWKIWTFYLLHIPSLGRVTDQRLTHNWRQRKLSKNFLSMCRSSKGLGNTGFSKHTDHTSYQHRQKKLILSLQKYIHQFHKQSQWKRSILVKKYKNLVSLVAQPTGDCFLLFS